MSKNTKCYATDKTTEPCSWNGNHTVNGNKYCGNHAKIARTVDRRVKQYQETANPDAPVSQRATDNARAILQAINVEPEALRNFAEEVTALVEAGISTQSLQWILDGWKAQQTTAAN